MLDTNNTPLVSIVLITWNGEKLLRKFLYSIKELKYNNLEVIIVDNNSTDNTVSYIRNNYPDFKIIINSENLGTAKGSNIGSQLAKGEFIFFTSNDMVYDPYLINFMVDALRKHEKIGAVACKVKFMTEEGKKTNIIDSAGGELDLFGFPYINGHRKPDNYQSNSIKNIFFAFGCSILVKKKIFDKLNGYDNKFLTLVDDIDLCWRINLLGYKIVIEPRALLYHRASSTTRKAFNRAQTRYMSEKNTLRMLLKNYNFMTLCLILPLYFIILGLEFTFYIIIGKFKISISLIKAVIWNISNFKDTVRLRKKMQDKRVVKDNKIVGIMMRGSNKFRVFLDFIKDNKNQHWRNFFGN